MRRLLMVLMLALGSAACGGDGEEANSAEPLRSAVRSYSAAYLAGDGQGAWELLSERCRERLSVDTMTALAGEAARRYDGPEMTSLSVEVSGDLGRATYSFTVGEINQDREPWAREHGAWHNDDC